LLVRSRISEKHISSVDLARPRTEAKEVIGGYWMIQVKSMAEAIEWASRCPGSDHEMIEIRQVMEFSDFPADVKEAAAGFAEMQAQPGRKTGP
jgi:hypothetical protein